MKDKILWIIISIFVLSVLGVMLVFSMKNEMRRIKDIDKMHFSYSNGYGMYENTIYDLEKGEDGYYLSRKPNGIPESETQEVKVSKDDIDKIIQVLNENKVIKWNGFHESNQYVLDGDSFSFSLHSGDIYISASGYMRWPNNYGIVKTALVEILDAYYNYGIKVYE